MNANQEDFTRRLKGAPFSVLATLLLHDRSLTNRQLQAATGYSDKLVTDALKVLERRKIVQYNGRLAGWSVPTNLQLPLFPHQKLTAIRGVAETGPPASAPAAPTPLPAPNQQDEIVRLLVVAGIAAGSRKMHELLDMGVTAAEVGPHIAAQQALGRDNYPASHVITNLVSGSPPPDARCGCGQCAECQARASAKMRAAYPNMKS